MKRLLLQILTALTLSVMLGGLAWVLYGAELTRCHTVEVLGNAQADALQIRHLANVALGTPLVSVDLAGAVRGAERHPWVARAQARRAFPDRVILSVQERIPTALLLLDKLYLVDETGHVFRQAKGVTLDLPVLTGIPESFATEQPDLARQIIRGGLSALSAASAGAPGAPGKISAKEVSEVRFDTRSGYVLVLRNGGEVLLGFSPDVALPKLARLARQGVDLTSPLRIDLGSPQLAVVTPL